MNEKPCTHCNRSGTANPRAYPGPVRKWWYVPIELSDGGKYQEVHLHACCVGPFMILNVEQDLLLRIAEIPV